jgi:hypothetical protein
MVGMAQGSPQGRARVTAGCNAQAGLTCPGLCAGVFFLAPGASGRERPRPSRRGFCIIKQMAARRRSHLAYIDLFNEATRDEEAPHPTTGHTFGLHPVLLLPFHLEASEPRRFCPSEKRHFGRRCSEMLARSAQPAGARCWVALTCG